MKLLIIITSLCFFTIPAVGQQIWQSDMSVSMTQSSVSLNKQEYTITIRTHNDDTSRKPHLIFTLPRNSKVIKVEFDGRLKDTAYTIYGNKSQTSPATRSQIDGYVKVDFPNLTKLKTTVKIAIERVPVSLDSDPKKLFKWGEKDGASAYVYSLTPELIKENNFFYLPLK